ncbi:MAG: glycosyltransferase [Chthonomonadales bacterium]
MAITDLRVIIIAPKTTRCGIADYSDQLMTHLQPLVTSCQILEPSEYFPGQADLVHIQHQYFFYGGVAPWKNRFPQFLTKVVEPVVLTAHEFVEETGSPLVKSSIKWTNRKQFKSNLIKRIIVHTNRDRELLISSGVDSSRVTVIRLGIPELHLSEDREGAKSEFGLAGKSVITLLGFFSAKKGHREAVDAIKDLPEECVLLIAGGKHPDDMTSYTTDLATYIEETGLSKRVLITGYLSPKKLEMAVTATDIFLAPFKQSSGSASLSLALASGRPIVVSDIEPHREIEGESPGSLTLYKLGDLNDLVEKIKQVLNTDLANGNPAAAEYCRKHSFAEVARQTVDLYQSVLSRKS